METITHETLEVKENVELLKKYVYGLSSLYLQANDNMYIFKAQFARGIDSSGWSVNYAI